MIQLAVVLTRFPEVSSASVAERNAGRTLPSAHVQDGPAVDQSASLLHGATRVPTAGSDERWPKPVLRRGLTPPASRAGSRKPFHARRARFRRSAGHVGADRSGCGLARKGGAG